MELGKCPICDNKLEFCKSIDVDDFKRYDLICKTDGCLINDLEWNYSDKKKLIKNVLKSREMVEKRINDAGRKKKEVKIHYESRGKSLCGQGEKTTDDPEKVTCGNCKAKPTFILLSKPVKVS